MSYRIKVEDGNAHVDLYHQQRRVLVQAVAILRDLAPYRVYDTEAVTEEALKEIEHLAGETDA